MEQDRKKGKVDFFKIKMKRKKIEKDGFNRENQEEMDKGKRKEEEIKEELLRDSKQK